MPINDDEIETILQVKVDRNEQVVSLILVDCWPFSKSPREAATSAMSVSQKILKHGQGNGGAAVRARNNGGGSVRRGGGQHRGGRGGHGRGGHGRGHGGRRNQNY